MDFPYSGVLLFEMRIFPRYPALRVIFLACSLLRRCCHLDLVCSAYADWLKRAWGPWGPWGARGLRGSMPPKAPTRQCVYLLPSGRFTGACFLINKIMVSFLAPPLRPGMKSSLSGSLPSPPLPTPPLLPLSLPPFLQHVIPRFRVVSAKGGSVTVGHYDTELLANRALAKHLKCSVGAPPMKKVQQRRKVQL